MTSHILIHGLAGTGKTTLAATSLQPWLVLFTDAYGKDKPYLDKGDKVENGHIGGTTPAKRILKDGKFIGQIAYFHDIIEISPDSLTAWERLVACFNQTGMDLLADPGKWATIIIDGISSVELLARKYDEYKLNPTHKDARSHYAQSANAIEHLALYRAAALPCNLVTLAHTNRHIDAVTSSTIYTVAMPGEKVSGRFPSFYSEIWYMHVTSEEGKISHKILTRTDGRFDATTQLDCPTVVTDPDISKILGA